MSAGESHKGRCNSDRSRDFPTVYCRSCNANGQIQGPSPADTQRSLTGTRQAGKGYVRGASATGPFLHIFPQQKGPALPKSAQSFVMQTAGFGMPENEKTMAPATTAHSPNAHCRVRLCWRICRCSPPTALFEDIKHPGRKPQVFSLAFLTIWWHIRLTQTEFAGFHCLINLSCGTRN